MTRRIHSEHWAPQRSQNCSLPPPQPSPAKPTAQQHIGSRRNPGFSWTWSPEPPPRGFSEKELDCLFAALLATLHHFHLSLRLQFSSSGFQSSSSLVLCSEGWWGSRNCVINQGGLTSPDCKMLGEVRFAWAPLRTPAHTHTRVISPWSHHPEIPLPSDRARLRCAEILRGPEGRVIAPTPPQPEAVLG